MDKSVCKQVEALLCSFIENKLPPNEKIFVENHIKECGDCYRKYREMREIICNLHIEYAKLLREFEKIEAEKTFNIREYELFYKNISPYIDDELCYDESVNFRKYLLKSKPARAQLADAYQLKNNIKNSVADFKETLNINFSKKVLKHLQEQGQTSFDTLYKKAAIVIGFLISTIILVSIYLGFSYMNEAFAHNNENTHLTKSVNIPNEDDMIEFTFEDNTPLLTLK